MAMAKDVDASGLPKGWRESVDGLALDSRAVRPGDLFFALPGVKADGARYAAAAVEAGARAVVADRDLGLSVPTWVVPDPRATLAGAAAAWFPKQPETICAVTGTAGKTSIASFLRQLWQAQGRAAAQIGTTGVIAPGRESGGSLTTPDPIALHALLSDLSDEGVTNAAMEASSHGLVQRRLDGVRLSAAAFTNLGRDHLDYHSDMEDYHRAKMRLFEELLPPGAPAVVHADDEWSGRTVEIVRASGREALTVGRNGAFIAVKRVEQRRAGQVAEITHGGTIHRIDLPLAGDFQLANALVAAALAIATGSDAERTFASLRSISGAKGRLEPVGNVDGAQVYVDYAHKPDALEHVLRALRPFTTGRLVVVFGCGGDRDAGKRPIMGEIAARLADEVIVTDDNPRSEEPATIRAAILDAAPGAKEIGDRAEAIEAAVAGLGRGDVLVVAGKGHETGQTARGITTPFSDHEVARAAIGRRELGA